MEQDVFTYVKNTTDAIKFLDVQLSWTNNYKFLEYVELNQIRISALQYKKLQEDKFYQDFWD